MMALMTELDAYRWIFRQPGMRVYVGATVIRLTVEGHIHVEAASALDCVIKAQEILQTMRHKSDKELYEEHHRLYDAATCPPR
jgi:citrate lyase gamma subunit